MAPIRPTGVTLLALLFLAWGLRALAGVSSGLGPLDKVPGLVLAVLTLATAYGLFKMRPWSLKIYVVWLGVVIAVGGVTEYNSGTPVIAIVAWLILMAAVYAAVGSYLRQAMRTSA